MSILAVIPARYASTRLPGKAIIDIAGKPMIQWVWKAAISAKAIERVIIATDDNRIREATEAFGAEIIMTSPNCKSGTDRVYQTMREIIERGEFNFDWVLNIQGDEPLLTSTILDHFASSLKDTKASMATIIAEAKDSELQDISTVKVVIDKQNDALYFSRRPIPFIAGDYKPTFWKHIGIYSYRPQFLQTLCELQPSPLELAEKLEQLRAVENGYPIHCVHIPKACNLIGVDTKDNLIRVRSLLQNPGAVHDPRK